MNILIKSRLVGLVIAPILGGVHDHNNDQSDQNPGTEQVENYTNSQNNA